MGNPTKTSRWIHDVYEKKERISKIIREKKVVIVAGSNALFGVNSRMLSEAFKMPIFNDSVNAGIELPGVLFMAQKVINRGDTVIMPLEYGLYSYNGEASKQMIDYFLSRRPAFISRLSASEQSYFYWHVTLDRIYAGYFEHSKEAVTTGIYGAHHINNYGDQTHTGVHEKNRQTQIELKKHIDLPVKYSESFDRHAPGWRYLEYFVQWCTEKNVRVIFMPPSLMWDASYSNTSAEQKFFTQLIEEIRRRGWRYIGDPYTYMYKNKWFFNTRYHLTEEGRERRTEQMIEDLNRSNFFK